MRQLKSWADQNRPTWRGVAQRILGQMTGLELSFRHYRTSDGKKLAALRQTLGPSTWQRCLELEYGVYDPMTRVLHVVHDAGLYSCLSASLWSLTDLLAEGHVPLRVDFTHTLSAYKDVADLDAYPLLFSARIDDDAVDLLTTLVRGDPASVRRFDPHGEYRDLPVKALATLLGAFFQPNAALAARTAEIARRFLATDQRYAGVWYRGTDKGTEVLPTDSSVYLELAERLLDEGRVDRVLIQTDQEQVGALFQKYFSGRCDAIDLLPRTRGQIAIHKGDEIEGSRLEYAMNMISAVTLMAGMEHVIVYTGNIGAWVPLMRGSCRGVWQATPHGILPQWHEAA